MYSRMIFRWPIRLAGIALLLAAISVVSAQDAVTKTSTAVNKKMVKLFGIGGFKGLPSYGTGILVSEKGHILTVNNHILNTPGILVHLYDGRLYQAKVVAAVDELVRDRFLICDDTQDIVNRLLQAGLTAGVPAPPAGQSTSAPDPVPACKGHMPPHYHYHVHYEHWDQDGNDRGHDH